MKPLKLFSIAFALNLLLGGCGGTPPDATTEPIGALASAADSYAHYGSFEAAMEASQATVRAVAGDTMAVNEIACGPGMSTTTEYTTTHFTVQEALKGDLQPGDGFELFQLGYAGGTIAYSGGSPLAFTQGEEYILCLFIPENGRHQLLTPYEGAYLPGNCAAEGPYSFQPYTGGTLEPYSVVGEVELELFVTDPVIVGPVEIVDIQGPFQIEGEESAPVRQENETE